MLRLSICCAALALALPQKSIAAVVFSDDFNRADSSTIGNGWLESEQAGMEVRIRLNTAGFHRPGITASNGNYAYIRRTIPTLGYNNITASGDLTEVGDLESGDDIILQYDLGDGNRFQNFFSDNDDYTSQSIGPIALPAGAANNPYLRIRLGGDVNAGASAEELRVDSISINGDDVGAHPLLTTLFFDNGSLDPGSNGWTVSAPGFTSIGSDGSNVVFSRSQNNPAETASITRTINTVGYNQIGFELFGTGSGTFEDGDVLDVQIDTGSGFTSIAGYGIGGTSIGTLLDDLILLPSEAGGISNLQLRILLTYNGADENISLDQIGVYGVAVPEPATSALAGIGIAAMALMGVRNRKRKA